MSEFDERPTGWVPLEGSGAWVPAGTSDTSGPAWPPPATASWGQSAQASPPPPPPPPPPAPPLAGGPGGWWAPGAGQPAPSPAPAPRRRRALPVVLATALVGAAGVVGLAIGHEAWPSRSVVSASAQGSTTTPNNSGSTGSGSTGSGSTGSGSTGSGSTGSGSSGSGGSYFGENPFGSGGSSNSSPFGSGGSGESPFGSGGTGSGDGSSSGGTASGSPADTAAIAAKVSPALVDINSTFSYQQAQGAGTGIVLTSNGEILTNNHVINGATKISVTDVGNGKTYDAKVVGYDDSHDVAVLQLQGASGLQTAKLGDSSTAAVGEGVVAIGNAGGTGGTPSYAGGSVTALNQSITASDELDGVGEQLTGLIQVNADIQPGDSGGSLVNTAGRVIGIDTAASSGYSFQSSGTQGYAIPIDAALNIANNIESGHATTTTHVGSTAFLGVELSAQGSQGSSGGGFGGFSFGSGAGGSGGSGSSSTSGVAVSGVVSGGPAADAGLASGDTITSLDGQTVDSPTTISTLLVPLHPGDKVQIGWVDSSGQSHTATVDLGSGPPA